MIKAKSPSTGVTLKLEVQNLTIIMKVVSLLGHCVSYFCSKMTATEQQRGTLTHHCCRGACATFIKSLGNDTGNQNTSHA